MGQVPNCIANYASSSETEEIRIVLPNSESDPPVPTEVAEAAPTIMTLRRNQLLLRRSPLAFSDVYQCGGLLGSGACSRVFAGKAVDGISSAPVAVKEFPSRHRRLLDVETQALAGLEHPHIIRLCGSFVEESSLRLALELCSGGDLFQRIQQERGLAEIAAQRIFWQMASAVAYLHAASIVHQDLKVENWLLISEGMDAVKLCDFGTITCLSADRPRERLPMGTFTYKAPEAHSGMGVATFADVWALGVALYTMLLGVDPFLRQGDTDDAVRERILSGTIQKQSPKWLSLAQNCRELLEQLFSVDETKRPACNRVLIHPWVLPGKPVLIAANTENEDEALAAYAPEILRLMEVFAALHPLQQLLLVICTRIPSSTELHRLGLGVPGELKAEGEATTIPWHALFIHLDADRDGKLGIGELRRGLSPFAGPDFRNWLTVIDSDGSGTIDWAEWSALAMLDAGRKDCLSKEVELIADLARLLDTPTGDERISEEDLAVLLPAASAETNRQLIATWISQCSEASLHVSSPPYLTVGDLHRLLSAQELCTRMRDFRRKI